MATTTFIPELWSARLLYALDKAHVATNLVNREYQGIIANQGDTDSHQLHRRDHRQGLTPKTPTLLIPMR